MVAHLPTLYETLGSIPSTTKKRKKNDESSSSHLLWQILLDRLGKALETEKKALGMGVFNSFPSK